MYRFRHIHTKQLIALLLLSVMTLVHAMKALHTHAPYKTDHACQHDKMLGKSASQHSHCDICDFQLAKDLPFTGEIQLVIAPVYTAPTYSRLLTAINPDRLFVTEGRGPPRA